MSKAKKPGEPGSGRNSTSLPYTDERKQTHAFASMRRTVRTGATSEMLTNYEIMERKQFESGLAGNSVSQRDYLRRAEVAAEARREDVATRCFIWSRIKAQNQRVIDQALASGAPVPKVLPHPDDVVIDWEDGPRLLGPVDEIGWQLSKRTADLRDLLYVQQAMEDAEDGVPMRYRPRHGGALMFAIFLNRMIAPSFRLSDSAELWRVYELKRVPKRQLLLDCRKAWREFGAGAVRGQRFGTAEALLPMLRSLMDAAKAFCHLRDDPLGYEDAIQSSAIAIADFISSARAKRHGAMRSTIGKRGSAE
ncbi:MAG: hypothetical protein MUE84_15265 [Hyphomonas sp.]|nr:hypothetical protein [Hyphomonas sp.]